MRKRKFIAKCYKFISILKGESLIVSSQKDEMFRRREFSENLQAQNPLFHEFKLRVSGGWQRKEEKKKTHRVTRVNKHIKIHFLIFRNSATWSYVNNILSGEKKNGRNGEILGNEILLSRRVSASPRLLQQRLLTHFSPRIFVPSTKLISCVPSKDLSLMHRWS